MEKEFEVYRVNPSTIDDWVEEIIANRRLLFTVARRTNGNIVELRLIFREGPGKSKEINNNLEQWHSLPEN
jgi:hypothetical protein